MKETTISLRSRTQTVAFLIVGLLGIGGAVLFGIASLNKQKASTQPMTTLTGRIHIAMFDDPTSVQASRTVSMLSADNGKIDAELLCTDCGNRRLPAGSRATITGILNDQTLTFAQNSVKLLPERDLVWTPEFNLGEQRTLVLLVEWDDRPLAATPEQVNPYVFGVTNSLADFYYQASGGKTTTTGDIFGPFNLGPVYENCVSCNVREAMIQLSAQHPEIDLATYKRVILMKEGLFGMGDFPHPDSITKTLPDGRQVLQTWTAADWGSNTTHLLIHESGHSFGAAHSNFLACETYFGDDATACRNIEAGNLFTYMSGTRSRGAFNTISKGSAGWLEDGVDTVTASAGRFTLAPKERESGTGIRQLILPYGIISDFNGTDPDPLYHYGEVSAAYTVEYRQPIGYDVDFHPCMTSNPPRPDLCPYEYGVFVNLDTVSTDPSRPWHYNHLIDAHPGTDGDIALDSYDAALLGGEGYYDATIGQSVSVVSLSPTGADIILAQDPEGCTRRMPEIGPIRRTPSGQIVPGDEVTYEFTVTNHDDVACGASIFGFFPTLPEGWSLAQAELTVEPQQTGYFVPVIASPAGTPNDVYTFPFSVKNANHYFFHDDGVTVYEAGLYACGDTIVDNTFLGHDLTQCPQHGLILGADNIVLDCQGHSITRPGQGGVGIDATGRRNVQIRNCVISGFSSAIRLNETNASLIVNNTLTGNAVGIFHQWGSDGNTIVNNTASNNYWGMSLNGITSTTISNNTTCNNTLNDITCSGSNNAGEYNHLDRITGCPEVQHLSCSSICGNSTCDVGETCTYCPADCGPCPGGSPILFKEPADGQSSPDGP